MYDTFIKYALRLALESSRNTLSYLLRKKNTVLRSVTDEICSLRAAVKAMAAPPDSRNQKPKTQAATLHAYHGKT